MISIIRSQPVERVHVYAGQWQVAGAFARTGARLAAVSAEKYAQNRQFAAKALSLQTGGTGTPEIAGPDAEKHSQNTEYSFSAKDVISTFGQDKWDAFWTQWQKDNPDWETWLDKAAVEDALAE
ncbi:MAG: hypothetical protein FWF88_00590 [Peptococcaceae bacterium]|nr:hypothetical protein [Peptococcaceae bacterium]